MSHPIPSHESDNEYPADGVSSYPQKIHKVQRAKKHEPLHNVGNRLQAKAKALRKRMGEVGGRFTKK